MRGEKPRLVLFHAVAAAIVVLTFLFAPPAQAQQGMIGLTLGVQPWDPRVNDDTVKFLYNNSSAVSDALNNGWNRYQPDLTTLLKQALGQPDLIAQDITLYDIDLRLTQPGLTIDGLSGSGRASDPYRIAIRILMQNEGLTATSTTPYLDRHLDPRCSLVFDASIALTVTVQNVPGAEVLSDQTDPNSAPIFNVTRFDFDSNNAPCDVLVDALKVTGLKTVISNMVTNPNGPISKPLNAAAHGLLKQALDKLDAAIAPYQKSQFDLVALHAWIVNSGGGQRIVLNLAPRVPIPDPGAGQGKFAGSVVAGKPFGTDSGSLPCGSLVAVATRKPGPAPMINSQGALGDAPSEQLTPSVTCGFAVLQPGQSGPYTVGNISPDFPDTVGFQSVSVGGCGFQPRRVSGVNVAADGWNEDNYVLPQNLAADHRLTASNISFPCAGVATRAHSVSDLAHPGTPGDPWEKHSRESGQSNPGYRGSLDQGSRVTPAGQQGTSAFSTTGTGSTTSNQGGMSRSTKSVPSSNQAKPIQSEQLKQAPQLAPQEQLTH